MSYGTDKFSLQLEEFIKKTQLNASLVVKKVAMDVFASIIKKTPVDTGRAKGNWQISLDTPIHTSRMEYDIFRGEFGAEREAEAQSVLSQIKEGENVTVFITNNLTYIKPLEFGRSQKQAPNGMVRVTIQEARDYLRKALLELE